MCSGGMSLNQVSDLVEDVYLFWSEYEMSCWERVILLGNFNMHSVPGPGCVWGLEVCTRTGEYLFVWWRFRPRWAELTCVLLTWTLQHSVLRGCCADQCDDKCEAWHLNVESLLALTDLVGSGVGQSGLVSFICNMISSPGFSVDWWLVRTVLVMCGAHQYCHGKYLTDLAWSTQRHNLMLETTLPVMIRFCQMTSDYNKYRSIISEVEWSKTKQEITW